MRTALIIFFSGVFTVLFHTEPAGSQGAAICRAINCDCENIEAGILNMGWKPHCRDRQKEIVRICRQSNGADLQNCDPVAHGPNAWPTDENRSSQPPGMESGVTVAVAMAESTPGTRRERLIIEDIILDSLEPYGPFIPGFEIMEEAARAKGAMEWASDVSVDALDSFQETCQPGEVPVQTVGRLLESQRAISESMPVPGDDVRKTIEQMERFNKLGLGFDELVNQGGFIPTEDSLFKHVGGFLDSLFKWGKAAESTSDYMAGDHTRADDFVDDTMSLVPTNVSPATASPVSTFFRDLLGWNADMYHETTEGLNFVADSIEGNCDADPERYNRIRNNLERLGQDGPWTEKTVGDSFKKMVTGIPGIGKVVNFFWPSGNDG